MDKAVCHIGLTESPRHNVYIPPFLQSSDPSSVNLLRQTSLVGCSLTLAWESLSGF
jgi:hypothetical protein